MAVERAQLLHLPLDLTSILILAAEAPNVVCNCVIPCTCLAQGRSGVAQKSRTECGVSARERDSK